MQAVTYERLRLSRAVVHTIATPNGINTRELNFRMKKEESSHGGGENLPPSRSRPRVREICNCMCAHRVVIAIRSPIRLQTPTAELLSLKRGCTNIDRLVVVISQDQSCHIQVQVCVLRTLGVFSPHLPGEIFRAILVVFSQF